MAYDECFECFYIHTDDINFYYFVTRVKDFGPEGFIFMYYLLLAFIGISKMLHSWGAGVDTMVRSHDLQVNLSFEISMVNIDGLQRRWARPLFTVPPEQPLRRQLRTFGSTTSPTRTQQLPNSCNSSFITLRPCFILLSSSSCPSGLFSRVLSLSNAPLQQTR